MSTPGFGGALVFAAAEHETRAFLMLLEAGAHPNVQAAPNPWTGELQRTPLHYAALHGSHEMLEALFAAGADLDAPDAEYRPPLALAVDGRKLHAIRALIDKGARPRRLSRDDQEKLRTIAKQRRWDDVLDELR